MCSRIAGVSDATKLPLAEADDDGRPLRTATIVSGRRLKQHEREDRANVSTLGVAARSRAALSCSTRCATTSVSVSVMNVWPCR